MNDGNDNQAVPMPDFSQMTTEELESAMAAMAGTQEPDSDLLPPLADEEDANPELDPGQTPEESTADTPPVIELDGEQLTVDQLKEGFLRHKDYTQKTQQLKEEQKKVEQLAAVTQAWETNPEMRPMIVQHLMASLSDEQRAALGGVPQSQVTPQVGNIDLDDLTENEQAIYLQGQREIGALKSQLQGLVPVLNEFKAMVEQQAHEKHVNLAAQSAAQSLMTDLGVQGITPDSVAAAMRETGIADPEAAWLKVNRKALLTAGVQQGVTQVKAEKPNAPGRSGTRTFDPYAKDADGNFLYSGDDAARLMAKGYKPAG